MMAVERLANEAVLGEAEEERSLLTALGPLRLPTAGRCTSELGARSQTLLTQIVQPFDGRAG